MNHLKQVWHYYRQAFLLVAVGGLLLTAVLSTVRQLLT